MITQNYSYNNAANILSAIIFADIFHLISSLRQSVVFFASFPLLYFFPLVIHM